MNDLKLFHNETFGQVRCFLDNEDNLWFVATDICTALELHNPHSSLKFLDADEKGLHTVDTLGGPQEMVVISEPGLYSLMFRSRKPEAKTFKRWITHEVIPAIRKTGQYKNPQATNTARQPGDIADTLSYAVTLRQLARLKILTPLMKAFLLAEAASLLSGHPMTRFLPAAAKGHEHWESPAVISRRYGLSSMILGRILKAHGLHGSQDFNHDWSQPAGVRSQTGRRGFIAYVYDPEVLHPHLEPYALAERCPLLK